MFDQVQDDVYDVSEAEEGGAALEEERSRVSAGREAVILGKLLRGGRDGDADQQLTVIPHDELEGRLISWNKRKQLDPIAVVLKFPTHNLLAEMRSQCSTNITPANRIQVIIIQSFDYNKK